MTLCIRVLWILLRLCGELILDLLMLLLLTPVWIILLLPKQQPPLCPWHGRYERRHDASDT